MKTFPVVLIASSIFLISCGGDIAQKATAEKDSYQVTKESLLKKEIKTPKDFLVVGGHDKRNFVGQTVVKGVITNKASVAVFKDVDIQLRFYSKTRALLETDRETVFEVLQPGESKNFKTKYFAPKGTDSVALDVLGAKVVSQ
jgi:hypothetical protein